MHRGETVQGASGWRQVQQGSLAQGLADLSLTWVNLIYMNAYQGTYKEVNLTAMYYEVVKREVVNAILNT